MVSCPLEWAKVTAGPVRPLRLLIFGFPVSHTSKTRSGQPRFLVRGMPREAGILSFWGKLGLSPVHPEQMEERYLMD